MERNTHMEFVGIPKLKSRHQEQLRDFQLWAERHEWKEFHSSHYDWWMFPIDEPSKYGFGYTVYEAEIAALKQDEIYVVHYLEGAALLARSWGWDIEQAAYIKHPEPGQGWQNWPIRLYKATKSLKLFGFDLYFESLKAYGQDLMRHGERMTYSRDLTSLFE